MYTRFTVIAAVVVVLTGCTTQWVKIRTTSEDLVTAKKNCDIQAEKKFPVKNEIAQKTTYDTQYENCEKKEDCGGEKYRTIRLPQVESYVMDVNEESRRNEFTHCMNSRGWEEQTHWLQ